MKTPIILIVFAIVMSLFAPVDAEAGRKHNKYSDGKRVTYVEKNYYRAPRAYSYPTYRRAYYGYRPYYYRPYYNPYYYAPSGGVSVSFGY